MILIEDSLKLQHNFSVYIRPIYHSITSTVHHSITSSHHSSNPSITGVYTLFLRTDTTVTIYFAARFVRLLFEGGIYFLGNLETSTTVE